MDTTFIDKLGGTCEIARVLAISTSAVSQWREKGEVPYSKAIRLAVIAEKRGIATRKELFPNTWREIWPELADKPGPEEQP